MELQNKIITVTDVNSAVTASGKKSIKIKDNDGLTYAIWETKSDGSQTQAFNQYSQLGNVLNQTYNISYTEKKMDTGKGYFRNIMQFGAKLPNSPQNASEGQNKPNTAPQEVDWDAVNFGKCKHAFLIETFKNLINKDLSTTPTLTDELEKQAERWAEMSMRKLPKEQPKETVQPPMPEDDIQVQEMPF